MIRSQITALLAAISCLIPQFSGAQSISPWVLDPILGVHYLTSINGNFTRTIDYQGESVQAILSLPPNGVASIILTRDIPNFPKESKGRWELRDGKVVASFDGNLNFIAQVISRTSRQQGAIHPRLSTVLYLQSNSMPQFLQGDYRQLSGASHYNPDRLSKVSIDRYINPSSALTVQAAINVQAPNTSKFVSIDDLSRQGENLDNEIERLKADLNRSREEQSAKERAEKIRASEEAARREAEKIQSAIEESNRRKIDAEQKKPGNVLDVLFSKRWQIGDTPCDRKGGTYMFYDKELGFSSVIDGRTQGRPTKNKFQFIQQGYLEVVFRSEVTARENDIARDMILSAGGSLSTLTARSEQHIRKINDNLLKVESKSIGINLENLLRNVISYSTRSSSHEFRACPASASALPLPSPPADSQISRSPPVASRSSRYYQPIFVCRDPYGAGRDETFAGILIQELVSGDDNVFVAMISNPDYSKFCHVPRTPNRLDEGRFRSLSEFVGQREGHNYYLTRWQGMVMGTIEKSE
jgi:hypothetical protein